MADYGAAGKAALGGAATGAGMGAVAGPWGAAIGAGIGGLVGGIGSLFGGGDEGADDKDAYRRQLAALAAKYGQRSAPQSSGAAQMQVSGYRGQQSQALDQLRRLSQGYGPSAAEIQMRQYMDRAAASQAGLAAGISQRGGNAGAALRNASNQTAALQAQGARDTAAIRAQEQAQYSQQYAQTLGQARGQDDQMSQFNAQAQNQVAMANLQASLQALGINTTAQLQALTASMQNAPQSMGTQLMAGAANAAPGLLQYYAAQKAKEGIK